MTPHQCWCVCGLKKSMLTAEIEGLLLPAMANSRSTGGPASFRPSELFYTRNGTFETKRIAHSKKAQGCSHCDKTSMKKDSNRPAQSTETCHASSPHVVSSHHIPLHSCHCPSTERERLSCCDRRPLAATAQVQHVQGNVAGQGRTLPSFPIFQEERNLFSSLVLLHDMDL